jgi:hypothetical protein
MVIYRPSGEQVHVLQKFMHEIPEDLTNLRSDLIGAVGLRRDSRGGLTTVYYTKQIESPHAEMQWVAEDMLCKKDLETLWLRHGRVLTEGAISSLCVYRGENPQNTISETELPAAASLSSSDGCQTKSQVLCGYPGHIKEAEELQKLPPISSTFTEPVHPNICLPEAGITSPLPLSRTGNTTNRPPTSRIASKQLRQSYSRTKTGCLSCRARKKKCDETRPMCKYHHAVSY